MESEGSFGLLSPSNFRGLRKSLTRKVISDASDEQQLPIVFRVVRMSLYELRNCSTHQVGFIDLMFLTNRGHLIFENLRES